MTPVTPESFAKWKKTRMDKKQAEEEAQRKAKDLQNNAGKNSGMSGRDLVDFSIFPFLLPLADTVHSSNTTPNGLQTKTTTTGQTTSIWNNTDGSRRQKQRMKNRTFTRRQNRSLTCHWRPSREQHNTNTISVTMVACML